MLPDHAFQRHGLLHGIGPDTTGEVLLEERERPDEGLMGGVVRAKFQGRQRVAGKSVRKYTLRRYSLFFKEMEAKSAEFSTPS